MPLSKLTNPKQFQEALKNGLSYFKKDLPQEIDFKALQKGSANYLVKNFTQSETYLNSITELRSIITDFYKIQEIPKSKPKLILKSKPKIQQNPNSLTPQIPEIKQPVKSDLKSKATDTKSPDSIEKSVSKINHL